MFCELISTPQIVWEQFMTQVIVWPIEVFKIDQPNFHWLFFVSSETLEKPLTIFLKYIFHIGVHGQGLNFLIIYCSLLDQKIFKSHNKYFKKKFS